MALVPASIRNRNPGAQYPGPSATKFGSTSYETLKSKDGVHKIATFPTHVHGAAAMFDLLERSYTGMTITAAIIKWCGDYYASSYIRVLEDKGGVKATDILTKDMVRNPEVAIPLCKAMAFQEAGRDYPLDDAGWSEGHSMAIGGASTAPAWEPGNDVPTPKPETRHAAWASFRNRVAIWFTVVGGWITWFFDTTSKLAGDVFDAIGKLLPLKQIALAAGANAKAIGLGIGVTAVIAVLCRQFKED